MSLIVDTITIDCVNPRSVADFWLALLGYDVAPNQTSQSRRRIRAVGDLGSSSLTPEMTGSRRTGCTWTFDQRREVDRALALGAKRVDVGQSGFESWVVLADPEGNEFCVLQSPADYAVFARGQRQPK
jgi:hypothetical protein